MKPTEIMEEAIASYVSPRTSATEEAQIIAEALTKAGYAIVPLEPTLKMSDAGFNALDMQSDCGCSSTGVWQVMIQAATKGEG